MTYLLINSIRFLLDIDNCFFRFFDTFFQKESLQLIFFPLAFRANSCTMRINV
jgi:hypothetical protein